MSDFNNCLQQGELGEQYFVKYVSNFLIPKYKQVYGPNSSILLGYDNWNTVSGKLNQLAGRDYIMTLIPELGDKLIKNVQVKNRFVNTDYHDIAIGVISTYVNGVVKLDNSYTAPHKMVVYILYNLKTIYIIDADKSPGFIDFVNRLQETWTGEHLIKKSLISGSREYETFYFNTDQCKGMSIESKRNGNIWWSTVAFIPFSLLKREGITISGYREVNELFQKFSV